MIDFYTDITNRYNIISLEDPFAEDDEEGWQKITKKIDDNCGFF